MTRLTRSPCEAPIRRVRFLPAESSPSAIQTPTLRIGQSDVKADPLHPVAHPRLRFGLPLRSPSEPKRRSAGGTDALVR